MRTVVLCAAVLALFHAVSADIYMHNPRGSNNRLDEANTNRRNANRLFDSQNNGKGGYNVGAMYYYAGSTLRIEWTMQHGCGDDGINNCDIILQYMCDDTPNRFVGGADGVVKENNSLANNLRDGTTTDSINQGERKLKEEFSTRIEYGRQEQFDFYKKCATRKNNEGLFLAGQRLRRNRATNTRQNPNGDVNPYGYECPEERDYYPYWHPTPWRDIAVLTVANRRQNCEWYRQESQNVKNKGECTNALYNTKAECESNSGTWVETGAWNIDPPECGVAPRSRTNHLGNGIDQDKGRIGDMPGGDHERGVAHEASYYDWTIPQDLTSENCALRIRYNISTEDINGPNGGQDDFFFTGSNGNNREPVVANYTSGSGVHRLNQNDPQVDFGIGVPLQLAINTAQFGRTFQDRSHRFAVRGRPEGVRSDAIIHNLNIRGKRGNIVQTYPAVEYDFIPNNLVIKKNDYVHIQWTGTNTNPNGNDGQGKEGTDRNNMVEMADSKMNHPLHLTQRNMIPVSLSADTLSRFNPSGTQMAHGETSELDDHSTYLDQGIVKFAKTGTYHYMSTRNNNFSNRSQKGKIVVDDATDDTKLAEKVAVAVTVPIATMIFLGVAYAYAAKHPASWVANTLVKLKVMKPRSKPDNYYTIKDSRAFLGSHGAATVAAPVAAAGSSSASASRHVL